MINKITKTLTLLLSLQLAQTVFAQSTTESSTLTKASIDEQVKEFMIKEDIPALAIGIIQNGKVTFTSTHGVIDRQSKQPINSKTIFQIGSHTKALTGTIAFELIHAGKMKLSDRVVDHLPEIFARISNKNFNSLTVEHLMVHRSGLPSYTKNVTRIDGDAFLGGYDEAMLIEGLRTIEFKFAPGEKWRYSNFNYALLGYVMSKVTNKSYAQLLKEYVSDKYELLDTLAVLSDEQKKTRLVTPYRKDKRQVATQPWDMGLLTPHGGAYSTIEDFAQLMELQIADYNTYHQGGEASPLVSTQVKYDTEYTQEGKLYPGFSYGVGMFEALPEFGMATETVYFHGGDLDGFGSEYRFSPEHGVGVVMLTSSGGVPFIRFAMSIIDQLLEVAIANKGNHATENSKD